ncbi:MAG: RNA polymerase subunit sigma [Planctomycetes bacterium]|nr:RNA polymerase subunit sigma [Planctomycetota bacterium]
MPEPNSEPSPPLPTPGPDQPDGAQMFALLSAELRRLAGVIARQEVGHTLQPTALVNELYMRFFGGRPRTWNDAVHFMRSAALTMERILVDHKRSRKTQKRGGEVEHQPLDLVVDQLESRCGGDLFGVHEALQQLAAEDPQMAEYVSLRFFGGRTNAEAAELLGIAERTGDNYWQFARAWLQRRLQQ